MWIPESSYYYFTYLFRPDSKILIARLIVYCFFFLALITGCEKEKVYYLDDTKSIEITDSIHVDNGIRIRDPIFNIITYNNFLDYLTTSDRFKIVPQKDFEKTTSTDKVIISIRHDIDDNINAAVKFAYLEHKYGIQSTYFILHTAKYYGETKWRSFVRNGNLIYYIKKIQDSFCQEIGWHNDLVTLQIIYEIDPKAFLRNELTWLRENGIVIKGEAPHGSNYCYIYHYVNSYFWIEVKGTDEGNFYNWESINTENGTIKIEKDSLSAYKFEYSTVFIKYDNFFSDSDWLGGKRWHMGMTDFDSFKPGQKVIVLIHPQHWDL